MFQELSIFSIRPIIKTVYLKFHFQSFISLQGVLFHDWTPKKHEFKVS